MRTKQAGITLIEITVVMAIVVLLVAVITPSFSKFRNAQALENTTDAVVSLLNEARTRTLAGVNDTSYNVRIESNRAVLFDGAAYSSGDEGNEVLTYETPVTGSATLSGGGSEIYFDRLRGTTDQSGTITLSISGGTSHTITITNVGSIMRN
jgi:type II secretory pathway pseudopilin PulG